MARAASEIDTPAKRARLAPRRNPYFQSVAGGRGGVSLGYRKPAHGPGTWIAKLVVEKRRVEERVAGADDARAEPGALPYAKAVTAALDWARVRARRLDDEAAGHVSTVPTVLEALDAYALVHAARIGKAKSYMAGTFKRHVAPNAAFASTRLDRLTAAKIEAWRKGLSGATFGDGKTITKRTINSILSQVRAGLNHAADLHRANLPAALVTEIKVGTKAIPGDANARKQVLPDADIRRLVDAAFAVDETGDFGRLVLVLAATGARFSQVARLTVADVQAARARIMMPPAHKGRRPGPRTAIVVPIGQDVLDQLKPVLAGRRGQEPLLLRWHHGKVKGQVAWARLDRRPWPTSTIARKEWAAALARAEAPAGTVMLCFRHSSIVRALTAGLPVRLVAAVHDTSVEMIEAHYSAYITDAAEELARRAVTPLAPVAATPLRAVGGAAA